MVERRAWRQHIIAYYNYSTRINKHQLLTGGPPCICPVLPDVDLFPKIVQDTETLCFVVLPHLRRCIRAAEIDGTQLIETRQ